LWRSLAKQGCSSDSERIELLERLRNLCGFERVVDLLGDREFASKQLLDYLHEHSLPYTLRINGNLTVNNKGKLTNISMLFAHLLCGESLFLRDKLVLGVVTNIAAIRGANGDIIIVITNTAPEDAIGRYEGREQIERMFSCLKTRGFNLEDTHITDPDKLERLLGVVTIAFCWAYKMGDQIDQCNPTPRKKHGRRIRSIFKTGYVYLANLISGVGKKSCEYANVLALLFHKDMSPRAHINWGYL
jgi:transposase